MTQTNGFHATNGAEWRKVREEGYFVQLPSSLSWVKLRPVAIDALMISGRIPDLLTPLASSHLWAPRWIAQDEAKQLMAEAKSAREYTELISIIVRAAMLEPKIVDVPQADDEITLDDLDIHDKFNIFNLMTQPLGWLRRFRDEQSADVEPVLHSEGNQPEGEQPSTIGDNV